MADALKSQEVMTYREVCQLLGKRPKGASVPNEHAIHLDNITVAADDTNSSNS